METTTFCCVQCRLLQPPTASCAECGTPMVAPVELVRELLHYRDMKMVSGRDWAFITAMIAGGSIAFPVLAPFALGSMVALGISKVRELRMRKVVAGIELPVLPVAPNARTVIGTPRKFRGTVASNIDDAHVLLEHAIVRDRAGGVLIRRAATTAFLVAPLGSSDADVDGAARGGSDGPVLVTGAVRLVAPGLFGLSPTRESIKRGDPRLSRMGVPSDLAISGELEVSSMVESELAIAVTGVVEDEAVADMAFHRNAGTIPVMRGHAGAPVLVEDRRLVGVALAR